MRLFAVVCVALVTGCATVPVSLSRVAPVDEAQQRAAAEAFYRAQTPQQLRDAVAQAKAAGPDSALFHEVAARLAQLEGRDADAIAHLLAALADTGDDAALLHLHQLSLMDLTWPERAQAEALYAGLVEGHPDVSVRAAAAQQLAALRGSQGDFKARDALIGGIPGQVTLAWAGTWDNDQGKGFDLELGPETRPGLTEKYEGRAGPVTWRTDVPKDPRGRYDLLQLMTPTRWAAAFAQGTFTSDGAPQALRLTTSDPLKVWVDGKLVFSAALLERSVFDHVVVPFKVAPGTHTVLIKSAHREGSWFLSARVTPFEEPPFSPTLETMLMWRIEKLSGARALDHLVAWAHLGAGGVTTVRTADAALAQLPTSLALRAWLIDALWFNQERGRTADLLAALDAEVGEQLPFIRLRQARFHQQQGLKQKARDRLLALQKSLPQVRETWDLLADVFRSEGWTDDEVRVLKERKARFGATPDEDLELARAVNRQGHRAEALAMVDEVLRRLPYFPDGLRREVEVFTDSHEYARAEQYARQRLASWPVDQSVWLQLSELQRRQDDFKGADDSVQRASTLCPECATPWARRGELAYEQGDPAQAITFWKRSLELNPENEALANRVEFLAPEHVGPWMADVPTEARLEELVRNRGKVKQQSGADIAYLLDHQVTLLNNDGSTTNIVTLVAHAFNAQGRDRIIRQSVGSGRLRVLHAYAVDEKGARSEASGERNRQIFFRGMQPGSTLVLQYRTDTPPRGYLSRYYNESWSLQGVGDQREESTLVLWAPLSTKLHEFKVGAFAQTEERRGELLRFTWSNTDAPPITAEPAMPTVDEVAANLKLSSVPDWKTWLSWEQALLEGVFRDSPELDAVAKKLAAGNPDANERLARIHTWVMEEIRYQQDYESFIAGVKPHPASMTLERKYGDCKDKAVLFIELARKLGLDAHFALVRTRDVGPVKRDVPMQQFNHAIVYVPDQPGVQGRFFDPTAELLDVSAVRSDDVGTLSLVFDPKTNVHTWREIPFQAPDENREATLLKLTLDEKGGATGTARLEGTGRSGSLLRRTARNEQVFGQVAQRVASTYLPNATATDAKAVEVESLRTPAVIEMKVATGTLARQEGDSLRLKLPTDANPRSLFALAKRQYPLLLGTPQQLAMTVELTVPEGLEISRLPASGAVTLPCLSLQREVKRAGNVVTSTQTYRTLCERISPAEYVTYRAKLDDMMRLLDDELVVGARKKKPVAAPKKK